MREEASPQDRRRPGAEKAKKRHQADVLFVEDGPEVMVVKKCARVTTVDEGEERSSGGSSFKSPSTEQGDKARARVRVTLGRSLGHCWGVVLTRTSRQKAACQTEVKERKDPEQRRRLVLDTGKRGWLTEAVLQVVLFHKQRFQWRSPWSCPLGKGRTWCTGWGRIQR